LSNNVPAVGSLSEVDDWSDFYRVMVGPGDVLEVSLSMQPGTDFDIFLYDPAHNLITSSELDNVGSGIYTESVTITLYTPGYYFIEVGCYSGSGTFTVKASTTAEWTVLVYLDADNDLESAGITDFMEMSGVGSTDEVNLLVQMDRISGYDSTYGDWTGTNRYLVTPGMTPTAANAVSFLGEVNMGDPWSLASFINWGIDNYPADRYMLVLWDHGGNWQGVCWDDTSNDNLGVLEMRIACDMVRSNHSGFSFDVIGFDACAMSGLEVLYEISGYTDQIVASQLNEPGPGWNYQTMCSALASNPFLGAYEISVNIAQFYVNSYYVPYPGYYQTDVTMAVIDASDVPGIITALNQVTSDMLNGMASKHNYYQTAWEASAKAYYDYPDLLDISYVLSIISPTALERQHASALYNATLSAIDCYDYYDVIGGEETESLHGMSIYFPRSGYFNNAYRTSGTLFSALNWDEMLVNYYSSIVQPNDPVGISSRSPLNDPSVAVGASQTFSVTVDDSDADLIQYFWSWDGYDLPVSSSGITVLPDTGDIGVHTLQVMVWDGASFAFSTWTVTVLEKPDLYITDFLKWDAQGNLVSDITSGRTTYAGVYVTNQGSMSCAFDATCYLDGEEFCSWLMVELAPGGTVLLASLPFSLSELGSHSIQFLVDPLDIVDESNESNNGMAFAMNVVPAEWTVLVYMDGDNNLESYMVDNFLQMSAIGSDANVSVVVQFDRISGYDGRYEDWTDCLRFYVEYGMTPTIENATGDLGEVNMADRSTLESFLIWGTSTFQAERYIVVLKDHGSSWIGCCQDETSGNDLLDLKEASFALRSMINLTGAPIDLLIFDDCLMGSVEVATEFKDLALYAVVSETVGWSSNHDYSAILSFLEASPEITSGSAALGITDLMYLVDDETHATQCVATYDLQRMDALLAALEAYLVDLAPHWQSDEGGMEMARLYSHSFDIYYGNDGLDLYQFVLNTMFFYAEEELNATGQEVLRMLDQASASSVVISMRATPAASFCHGMSAYFPISAAAYNPSYGNSGSFCTNSVWDSMVYTYLTYSAPLTLLFLEGTVGDDDWYVSQVNATFLVYDPSSLGKGYLNYSFGGLWYQYSGETLVMSEDGDHTLFYCATGLNGEVEVVRNAILSIDKTAPSIETQVNGLTFQLSATDDTSGVRSIHYRVDGGSWLLYTGEVTLGTVGHQYLVEYYALDNAGNACLVGEMTLGEEDTQAPQTLIELLGTVGNNGWFTSDAQAVLSADDGNGVGVSSISFQIDGGEWQTYSGPLWFNETGTYVLNYRSEDAAGNLDIVRAVEVKVDEIVPTAIIGVRDPDHGVWYNHSVPVSFGGNDEGSGLYAVQYRLNGGSWNGAESFVYSTEAISLLEWRAVDNAGNLGETHSRTIRLDSTSYYVQFSLWDLDSDHWSNDSVIMDIHIIHIGPANDTYYYRVNGGNWTEMAWRAYFNESGEYYLEVRSVDEANNTCTAVSKSHFWIDRVLPVSVLNVTGLSDSPNVYLNSIMIDIEGTDEGKGMDRCMYRIGNGTWREITAPFSLTQAGDYALEYYSVDLVGNSEEVRFLNLTVKVAYVPGQIIGLNAEANDDGVAISWSAPSDGGTPIMSYKVLRSVNGGAVYAIAEVAGTSFYDDEVSEGNTYEYFVQAVNLLGEGPSSVGSEVELQSDEGSNTSLMVPLIIVIIAVVAVLALVFVLKRKK